MYNLYCSKCKKIYKWETKLDQCKVCEAELKVLGKSTSGGYIPPGIHAIYETDTGQQIPIDKKGNVVDHNIYANDKHGWKRSGQKIKDRKVIFK